MNYSVKFVKGLKCKNKAEELRIAYHDTIDSLLHFIKKQPSGQRIVLDYSTFNEIKKDYVDDIEILSAASSLENPFAVLLPLKDETIRFSRILKDRGIPFFFNIRCNTWDEVNSLAILGVSDIYIVDELAFNIKEVSKFCHSRNILVRIYPNVCQGSGVYAYLKNIKLFFVRPEGIKFYEDYVDVCEIFGELERQDFIFETYKNGKWNERLSLLITGYYGNINSGNLLPDFELARLGCKKKCNYHYCDLCPLFESNAKISEELGVEEYKVEDEEELTEEEDAELEQWLMENEAVDEDDEDLDDDELFTGDDE